MNIDQEIRLAQFIEDNLGRPFAWGRCDCNTFVLEAMDVLGGTALADEIRGRYKTARGAIRFRRRSPWGGLITGLQGVGFAEIPRGFEQTGDILIVAEPDKWDMSHLFLGRLAAAAFPEAGVQQFSMTQLRNKPYRVWRSPCLQR